MGPAGAQNLGAATFTVAVDTAAFGQGLKQAEGMARQTSQAIGQSMGRGGSAGMGLLYLGQAADDLQYGFRSIVNNIPQLVMAMGGGAGVAGAVGVAAVAVNQLISHWDALKATFGDMQNFRDAQQFFTDFKGLPGSPQGPGAGLPAFGAGGLALTRDKMEQMDRGQAALAEGRARDQAAGAKLFEKAEGEVVDKQKAADFKAAIDEAGGMKKVLGDALREAMKAKGADADTQKGRIAKWFEAGMQGGDFDPGAFGGNFGQLYDAQGGRRSKKREDEETKQAEDARNKKADLEFDHGMAQMQAEMDRMDDVDREVRESLRKRVEDLQEEKRGLQGKAEDIRWAHQDDKASQVFSGTRAFATHALTESLDNARKDEIVELRAIKKATEKLDDTIRLLRIGFAK